MNDSLKLWLLNQIEKHHGRLSQATFYRQRRQGIAQQIAEHAEAGQIAVIESGRDCDGVCYSGYRHIIPASVQALDALANRLAKSADGFISLTIARPSEDIEYTSRDLTLEAFENGHPHCLVV